jgi:PAS domain S-box-containing protein
VQTRPLVDSPAPLVQRIALGGSVVIALAVAAMLLLSPTDPRPDWVDIFQEGVFFAAGLAAAWASWRVDSPSLMAGVLLLTMSFALEVADEFVVEPPFAGNQVPAAFAASGVLLIAWALAQLGARQRQGRLHLQSSEERFHLLFDLCPLPLIVCKTSGEFITVNSSFEHRTGYKQDALIGRTPWELDIFDASSGEAMMRKLRESNGGPIRHTMQVRTRMGAIYTIIMTVDRIELPEGPAVIAAAYNVTDQESLLRELERYQGQLEVAAMKDEFIANMSHKLHTPVTSVIAAAQDLASTPKGSLTSAQRASVAAIDQNAQHLLVMIDDILELSRLDSGRVAVQREPVDVSAVCDEAWTDVSAAAEQKWLEGTVSMAKGVDTLFTDRRRLKSILAHLLDNAVKFTPAGGRIGLEVSTDQPKGLISFTVWDSGGGITAADQARLFQPFVQLDPTVGDGSGTGLGLAIVRRTARALGGDAHVESAAGKGSRFTVFLPFNPPTA